jgi:hypothetical protein
MPADQRVDRGRPGTTSPSPAVALPPPVPALATPQSWPVIAGSDRPAIGIGEIGAALVAHADESGADKGASGRAGDAGRTAVESGVVRVLVFRLDPPDYGTLTVRMRIEGRALSVRLLAEDGAALRRLQEEADGIRSVLGEAGYEPEVAVLDGRRDALPLALAAATGNGGVNDGGSRPAPFSGDGRPKRQAEGGERAGQRRDGTKGQGNAETIDRTGALYV